MSYRQGWGQVFNNYQKQKKEIEMRQQQPVLMQRGNYRVDNNGNPIINTQPQPQEAVDYFEKDLRPDQAPRSPEVYHLDHYQKGEDEWVARMRQPQSRTCQQGNYFQGRNTAPNNSRSVPYLGNHSLSQNRSSRTNSQSYTYRHPTVRKQAPSQYLYYRLHQWLSHHQAKSRNATLPTGRVQLAAVFLIIYIILLISGRNIMPFNLVNQVKVVGNEIVASEFIILSSRIYPFDRYQEIMKQQTNIKNIIKEENPMVETVEFKRDQWQALEIKVSEHEFVGVIEESGIYQPMLSNGEVVDLSHNEIQGRIANQSLPQLIDFNTSGQRLEIAKGLRQIDGDILSMMENIRYINDPNKPNAIEVTMKDGNLIKAIMSTFSQKVQHYPEILSQLADQKGIINFEVGAYFTPNISNANSIKLDSE